MHSFACPKCLRSVGYKRGDFRCSRCPFRCSLPDYEVWHDVMFRMHAWSYSLRQELRAEIRETMHDPSLPLTPSELLSLVEEHLERWDADESAMEKLRAAWAIMKQVKEAVDD